MIRLIIAFTMVFAFSVNLEAYQVPKQGSDRAKIAKIRAAKHPKGSGIGTNRYTKDYNRNYTIDKYKRK